VYEVVGSVIRPGVHLWHNCLQLKACGLAFLMAWMVEFDSLYLTKGVPNSTSLLPINYHALFTLVNYLVWAYCGTWG
jgi:hypothetical protein